MRQGVATKTIAFGIAAAVALIFATALPGQAAWGWHRPAAGIRVFAGPRVFIGAPLVVGPAVTYADPYPNAYTYDPVLVDVPRAYMPPPAQPDYWYYCRESRAYYPYVSECPGGWMTVQPTPAPNP